MQQSTCRGWEEEKRQEREQRERQEAAILIVSSSVESTACKRITDKSLEQMQLIRLHCEYETGKSSASRIQKRNKIWEESWAHTQFL